MPETAISPAHFELDASILRRQRRVLGAALAWYLPAGLFLTAVAAWSATWPGDVIPSALIADHVTLAGTSVPIPWSHVQGATITPRDGRFGLSGVIACPDSEPEPSCRFTNRSIKFHIDEALYNTTVDDIASAFARHTTVVPSADRAL